MKKEGREGQRGGRKEREKWIHREMDSECEVQSRQEYHLGHLAKIVLSLT